MGTAEFTNEMRIIGKNSAFFKPVKSNKVSDESNVERHRIWLDLRNKEGIFKQILVGYIQGATNSYDENYDAEPFNGNEFVDFYSIIDNKNLVIQGRALPFVKTDSIVLGYKTAIEGDFDFSIDHVDGVLRDTDIFIEDKDLKIIQNLNEAPYQFSSKKGTFNDRFILKFTNKTLAIDDFESIQNDVLVLVKNKMIFIDAMNRNIKEVAVFDISGRKIYKIDKVDMTKLSIQNLFSEHQILLVKVTLENGKTITKKVPF